MRIAIFASAFHPSLGGVEELCRQLALELMRQGHGVIVLTNRWPRDLPAAASIDGIPVYRLPFRLPEGSAKAAINYHLTHRRVERDMLAILRSHHIDMLHVQCVSSNAHYAMIAQNKLGLPLVVTLQGELTMDANQIFQKSPQAQEILRRALDRAQVITGCSGKTLRDGEEFYGKPFGDHGRVIFNGVNLADFAVAPRSNETVPTPNRDFNETPGAPGLMRRPDGLNEPDAAASLKDNEPHEILNEAQRTISLSEAQSNVSLSAESHCSLSEAPRSYIFALGRMAKQKGFDVLIQAYGLINEQRTTVHPGAPGNNDQRLTTNEDLPQRHKDTKWGKESGVRSEKSESVSRRAGMKSVDENVSVLSVCGVYPVRAGVAEPRFPDLILAGDGPELENLKSLARDLGLADRVHFPGRADRRQVASYMAGCEFFVISSPAEPFGIVILEAMAAGAPVIAVNNAGPAEIITDGVNGLLVERSEPALLAAAMQRLIGDPELRDRLSQRGRLRAAAFSWGRVASQYVEAYVAAGAALPGPGNRGDTGSSRGRRSGS